MIQCIEIEDQRKYILYNPKLNYNRVVRSLGLNEDDEGCIFEFLLLERWVLENGVKREKR